MNKEKACKILHIHKDEILTKDIIRKKYLKISIKTHPDKTNKSSQPFIDTKNAYEYLLEYIKNNHTKNSPLFYCDNDKEIRNLFFLFKNYIVDPFEKHITSFDTFTLQPSLLNLFNKDLYYIKEYNLYIPLWHNELLFENLSLKIRIEPKLENYIKIDVNNNIHIYLQMNNKYETIFFIGNKKFLINVNKKNYFHKQGIPLIDEKNIYNIIDYSDVVFHLS